MVRRDLGAELIVPLGGFVISEGGCVKQERLLGVNNYLARMKRKRNEDSDSRVGSLV